MVANIRGYTPNYAFKLVNFDTPRWHTLEYANWTQLDGMLLQAGIPQIRGEWAYSTLYFVGDRVYDIVNGLLYRCLVEHTSAASGTFEADRLAHPTYWVVQTLGVPVFRGQWQVNTTYSLGEIVFINAYQYYLCTTSHKSTATFDGTKWALVFDATAAVNSTNASATAAAGSASQAATSASNAATSATNAQASAVESAAQAQKLFGTSTSSNTIGLTAKTFVTQADKYFNVGKFVMIRADLDPINNWMWGQVSSYTGTTLVVNSIVSNGAGTFVSWIIDVSGSRGAIGPQGAQGEIGPPLTLLGTVPSEGALPPTGNTIGDMYQAEDNGHVYVWDGTEWDDLGALGTSTTTTADVPPTDPKDGDMWWESDSGIFWVFYDDGNTSQWVQAGGAAASINQNFVVKTGDTMTGDLTIDKADASIILNKKASGQLTRINALTANAPRWSMQMGNATPETGSDAGSNFVLYRFSDAGAFVDALTISRATGATSLSSTVPSTSPTTGALTVAGGVGVGGRINAGGDIACGSGTIAVNASAGANAHFALRDDVSTAKGFLYWSRVDNTVRIENGTGQNIKLTSTGNVAIDAATPSTSPSTGALTVVGGVGVGGNINAGNGSSPATGALFRIGVVAGYTSIATRPGNDANQWQHAFENAAGAVVGTITANTTTTNYGTSSDASLKEDLKSFDAGSIIDDTEVYDFAWKSTKERAFGVIAQQAVDVYPLAVTHTEANTEKGAERDEWWGVDYSKYVPVLLQELKALRARVAELEGRIVEKPSTTPRGRK